MSLLLNCTAICRGFEGAERALAGNGGSLPGGLLPCGWFGALRTVSGFYFLQAFTFADEPPSVSGLFLGAALFPRGATIVEASNASRYYKARIFSCKKMWTTHPVDQGRAVLGVHLLQNVGGRTKMCVSQSDVRL
jgi:hypothetical protein